MKFLTPVRQHSGKPVEEHFKRNALRKLVVLQFVIVVPRFPVRQVEFLPTWRALD